MSDNKITLGPRLASMLLDHCFMCFIIIPPMVILDLIFSFNKPFESHPLETAGFMVLLLVYINKDFVNARSPAKRILGFRVVDRKTGEAASELKCFLRNLTIPIAWPLEVLISLFSKDRRLGDIIANTKIEMAQKEELKSILTELKNKRIGSDVLWILVVGIAYTAILWGIQENITKIL